MQPTTWQQQQQQQQLVTRSLLMRSLIKLTDVDSPRSPPAFTCLTSIYLHYLNYLTHLPISPTNHPMSYIGRWLFDRFAFAHNICINYIISYWLFDLLTAGVVLKFTTKWVWKVLWLVVKPTDRLIKHRGESRSHLIKCRCWPVKALLSLIGIIYIASIKLLRTDTELVNTKWPVLTCVSVSRGEKSRQCQARPWPDH